MRLIDADMLIRDMEENPPSYGDMDRVIAAVNNAPTVGGWISVKDRLPEIRHAVLVYTPHHYNIWAASLHEDGDWYFWMPLTMKYDPDWYGPVTYWMPLPTIPEANYNDD